MSSNEMDAIVIGEGTPDQKTDSNLIKTLHDDSNTQAKSSNKCSAEKEEEKILQKKIKRSEDKKINRDLCSICRYGGDLLLCDNCPRSFHIECLKIKKEDIPEGKWYCPKCAPKMQKKLEKFQKNGNLPEDKEKERKRLLKNEKRRLWRLKKKEKLEEIKNSHKNLLINKDGNALIDSFLAKGTKGNNSLAHSTYLDYINKMMKLPLMNSKICVNITYTSNTDTEHINKSLSLPLLFPIPNNVLMKSNSNINLLEDALNKKSSIKQLLVNVQNNNKINGIEETNIIPYINSSKLTESNSIDEEKETRNILKIPNSINALNKIIEEKKDLVKYNLISRDYWDMMLQKKSSFNSKHAIKFPIDDKELYSFPDIYGLEEKYLIKNEGQLYPHFNGKLFIRLINIYDFLMTFSTKLYLSNFSLEEFYCALKFSETYTESEIILVTSIHVSLIYLLFVELADMQLLEIYNNGDNELLIIKLLVDYYINETKNLYLFIYQTWPELIRLILSSDTFNQHTFMNEETKTNLNKKLCKVSDIISYNSIINLEDKLNILEELVLKSYETNFIRNAIKEAQEKKKEVKKVEKDLEEELKEIESKKKELERQEQFTQPQAKIEEINKKLSTLSEDNSNMSRVELSKLRKKLEHEKGEFKSVIRQLNNVNNQREDILNKIDKVKNEIFDIPTVGKKCIGVDGRGYKYYYFPWMLGKLFIRITKKNSKEKYEWRIIEKEENIKELMNQLSEKGIHESALKHKLKNICTKKIGYYRNSRYHKENKENNETNNDISMKLEDIFNKQVLKYENFKNPLRYIKSNKTAKITKDTKQFDLICEKIHDIEENVTNYLSRDDKQWESFINRSNIKAWLTYIDNIKQYSNFLVFLNERVKNPYKIENSGENNILGINKNNKKIIDDDEIENEKNENNITNPIDNNGNLNIDFVNNSLQLANKIRLWSKEFEAYSLEQIYINYVKDNSISFPVLNICIDMFDLLINDLNKRREFYKKRNEDLLNDAKNSDNKREIKIHVDDESNNNAVIKGGKELRKNLIKKKMIDWNDKCMFCGEYGDLMCCEDCPNVAHLKCTELTKLPDVWRCDDCLFKLTNRRLTRNSYKA